MRSYLSPQLPAMATNLQAATLEKAVDMNKVLDENKFLRDRLQLLSKACREGGLGQSLGEGIRGKVTVNLSEAVEENKLLKCQLQVVLIEQKWEMERQGQKQLTEAALARQTSQREHSAQSVCPSPIFSASTASAQTTGLMQTQPVLNTNLVRHSPVETFQGSPSIFSAIPRAKYSPKTGIKSFLHLPTSNTPAGLYGFNHIPAGLYGEISLGEKLLEQSQEENTKTVFVKVFNVSNCKKAVDADPAGVFVKLSLGNTSYRTRVECNSGDMCSEINNGDVYSFPNDTSDRFLKLIVYDAKHVLGEGEINLSKQSFCETAGALRCLSTGIPYKIAKDENEFILNLAFAACNHVIIDQTAAVSQDVVSPNAERRKQSILDPLANVASPLQREAAIGSAISPNTNFMGSGKTYTENLQPIKTPITAAFRGGFEVGSLVMVHSMQNMTQYNGMIGRVSMFLDNEKIGVSLHSDKDAVYSFHHSKLQAVQHPTALLQEDKTSKVEWQTRTHKEPDTLLQSFTAEKVLVPHALDAQVSSHALKNAGHNAVPMQSGVSIVACAAVVGVPPAMGRTKGAKKGVESASQAGDHLTENQPRFESTAEMPEHTSDSPQIGLALLKIGARVRVHSVNTAVEYNGKVGTIHQIFDNGRIGVMIDDDVGSIVIFKPNKLDLLYRREKGRWDQAVNSIQPVTLPEFALSPPPSMLPQTPSNGPGSLSISPPSLPKLRLSTSISSETRELAAPHARPVVFDCEAGFGAKLRDVHVKVVRISNFKDKAGWMDKTDPFVKLTLGNQSHKTKVKSNAGGTVVFNELFSFPKESENKLLKAMVYDSDTISDDIMGQAEIDISRQPQCVTVEALQNVDDGIPFKMVDRKTGMEQGILYLAFALACSPDADSMHSQVRHGSTNINLSGQRCEKADSEHEVDNSRRTVLAPGNGKQPQARIIRLPFDRQHTDQTVSPDGTVNTNNHAGEDSLADILECTKVDPQVIFEVGSRVRVHSLHQAPHFNEQIGIVNEILGPGRLGVLLDSHPNAIISLKPQNVVLVADGNQISEQTDRFEHKKRQQGGGHGQQAHFHAFSLSSGAEYPLENEDAAVRGFGLDTLPEGHGVTGLKFWSNPQKKLMIAGLLPGLSVYLFLSARLHIISPDFVGAGLALIGTSAQGSGLAVGDTIIAVDGKPVMHLEPFDIVLLIAGVYQSKVALKTRRGFEVVLIRDISNQIFRELVLES